MAKTTKTSKKAATKSATPSVPASNPAPSSAQAKPISAAISAAQSAQPKLLVPAPAPVPAPQPVALKPEPALPKLLPIVQISKPAQAKPATSHSNRISLELVKPEAKSVFVAGSFNEWKPDMTPLLPVGNGHWIGDLAIKPGRHEYLFVVDGQWLPDPNAKESVGNPFGGKNSVLVVSE